MRLSIDAFSTHRIGLRAVLCSVAFASFAAVAGAAPTPAAIESITLEKNGFGAPTGSVLVLRRDGLATLTRTGSARASTDDAVSKGTVGRSDFDALARLIVARGFYALDDVYQDPALRDGSWATVTVMSGADTKSVFVREDAGPAAWKEIEAAVERAQSRIAFTPVNR